jgi:hypothetical protein
MAAHIQFLGALFVVWGLVIVLVGASTLALGIGALTLLTTGNRDAGGQLAAGATSLAFIALALIAVVWGAAHAVVGLPLRRHAHWSRLAALMLGAVDLVLLPYGTALGLYALWALLREDGKKLFEPSG